MAYTLVIKTLPNNINKTLDYTIIVRVRPDNKPNKHMTYIVNTSAIILYFKGTTHRIDKTDKKYHKILEALKLPKEEQDDVVENIILEVVEIKSTIEESLAFEIRTNDDGEEEIFYNNERLPKAFSDKVISIIADDLPLDHFEKFWQNLEQNPSRQSIEELIQFLDYKELPITEDGCFLAYKGVRDDYYSLHGNTETKVIQGTVDEEGHIYNGVGEVLEVRRRDVDDDRTKHCSHGLHCGSLDYARGFTSKLIVVKVNPADVVSVPSDCSCQKCRVSKYTVVSNYSEEITSSVVNDAGEDTLVKNYQKERSEFVDKVDTYLSNKRSLGWEEVTTREIQNSFSFKWATKQQVLDALQELGEYWETNDLGVTVVVL
jgi:hypothetical protein